MIQAARLAPRLAATPPPPAAQDAECSGDHGSSFSTAHVLTRGIPIQSSIPCLVVPQVLPELVSSAVSGPRSAVRGSRSRSRFALRVGSVTADCLVLREGEMTRSRWRNSGPCCQWSRLLATAAGHLIPSRCTPLLAWSITSSAMLSSPRVNRSESEQVPGVR